MLSFDETVALIGCFVQLGVERVPLTGGEPAGFVSIEIDAVAIEGFDAGAIGALCACAFARGLSRASSKRCRWRRALHVPRPLLAAHEIRAAAFPGAPLVPGSSRARPETRRPRWPENRAGKATSGLRRSRGPRVQMEGPLCCDA